MGPYFIGSGSELEQYMENRIKKQDSASVEEISYLCIAYAKLKRYDKLFACLDEMGKPWRDSNAVKPPYILSVVSTPEEADCLAASLRAEALIDFGDYHQALREANRAYSLIIRARGGISDFSLTWGTTSDFFLWDEVLPVLGLSQALNGEKEKAQETATFIEQTLFLFYNPPGTLGGPMTAAGVAKIYMALGEYEKALQLMKRIEAKEKTDVDNAYKKKGWFSAAIGRSAIKAANDRFHALKVSPLFIKW